MNLEQFKRFRKLDRQSASREMLLYRLANIIIECKKIPETSDIGECDEFCIDRDLSLTEVFKIARGDYDKLFSKGALEKTAGVEK